MIIFFRVRGGLIYVLYSSGGIYDISYYKSCYEIWIIKIDPHNVIIDV